MTKGKSITRPGRLFLQGLALGVVVGLALAFSTQNVILALREWNRPERVESIVRLQHDRYSVDEESPFAETTEAYESRKKQLATTLVSSHVIRKVLADEEVSRLAVIQSRKDPAAYLQRQLYVTNSPDNDLLHVGIKGDSRDVKELQVIVDQIVAEGTRQSVAEQRRKADQVIAVLQTEVRSAKRMMVDLRDELERALQNNRPGIDGDVPDEMASAGLEMKLNELKQAGKLIERILDRQQEVIDLHSRRTKIEQISPAQRTQLRSG